MIYCHIACLYSLIIRRMIHKMVTVPLHIRLWHRASPFLLAFSWLFGMVLGCVTCIHCREQAEELILQSVAAVPSFVGAVSVVFLPFLLSAFAVSICEPWLLLIISTFKAFSFTFCAWGVCLAFGQSSWLVLFLFLFSDLCLIPFQYFYWLRHIRSSKHPSACELPVLLAIALSVGCVDYWFISPFLVSLLK